ncbi:immunoglobulin mu Fc receptor [Ctenodactylus gundi]
MDIWFWLLCFLPVSGAFKMLPEVSLDGDLGGSVTIKCPLPGEIQFRLYLCRETTNSAMCATVVSNTFVKQEYKHRVTLKRCSSQNMFVVEITKLTESDSGVYACGVGMHTDRGKTQKVILKVHRATTVSAQHWVLWPQGASYNHHTSLHKEREFSHGAQPRREGQGLPILIPCVLGLLLLVLLGLVVARAVQRRRALSRRVRRLAVRMRALEASRRPGSQRRQRSRSNVYSACPRRARDADAEGEPGARRRPLAPPPAGRYPPPRLRHFLPPVYVSVFPLLEVPESPWTPAPSLTTSCEYVTICHQPAAVMEDTDSNDYINIASLTYQRSSIDLFSLPVLDNV